MCVHIKEAESQEGLSVCSQQEAGITGGIWVCAHNRKLESQEGLGVCSQQEAGITGGV